MRNPLNCVEETSNTPSLSVEEHEITQSIVPHPCGEYVLLSKSDYNKMVQWMDYIDTKIGELQNAKS